MKLIIDIREAKLIKQFNFDKENSIQKNLLSPLIFIPSETEKFITKSLPVGDIWLVHDNDEENPIVVFERKTIDDLLSSIKDGRYAEQSTRLCSMTNPRNVYYIIEGKTMLSKGQDPKIIHSAIFSLSYYHGFNVLQTTNCIETFYLLTNILDKLSRENKTGREPFHLIQNNDTEIINPSHYSTKKRNDNITPSNFLAIVLCSIPSISTTIATAITKKYTSLYKLIDDLNKCPTILMDIEVSSKRKVGKKTSQNIATFLCQNSTELLNI
jgi:ERCC4-type nuclease